MIAKASAGHAAALAQETNVELNKVKEAQRSTIPQEWTEILFSMTIFHEPIMSSAFHRLCVKAAAHLLDKDKDFKFTKILCAIATHAPSLFCQLQNDVVGIDTISATTAFTSSLQATALSAADQAANAQSMVTEMAC